MGSGARARSKGDMTGTPATSMEDELRLLRAVVRVQRLADDVIEDCLARQMGISAALDVYLAQCAGILSATSAYVELCGTVGPVLSRTFGETVDVAEFRGRAGTERLPNGRLVVHSNLNLAHLKLGQLGFIIPSALSEGSELVLSLVRSMAETLDTSLLAFLALAEGQSALERLDELHTLAAFRPRGRIGKYELLAPLGAGGMAQVMVARLYGPEGLSRLVAVKRILPHLASDASMVDQFLDEAKLGLRFSHENLVTTYDVGKSASGEPYIAMELVRGVTYEDVLTQKKLPALNLSSLVLAGVLEGLHAAHELKDDSGQPLALVHRDLSPHNVMVGFDGGVKILDFGVAKMRGQRRLTIPGIVKGKPLYMSPEQACGESIDQRSDIFSVGLMLYEAAAGIRAFEKDTDLRTMQAIVDDPLERPDDISNSVWSVVEKALQKAPKKRFRSALEMRDALVRAIAPATAAELGRHITEGFPRQLETIAQWETMARTLPPRASSPNPAPGVS